MAPFTWLIDQYRHLLDLPPHTARVTLHEGHTPLIPAPNLANALGGGFKLWVKYEGLNPTGSFKDRGMTAAISEALGRGAKSVICASTGNTAASAAAYAARAGMRAIVIIPQGKVAAGKLVSMAMKTRPIAHSTSVTGVYTPPEHRRQGYASALVANLSQYLLNEGNLFVNLFTDLDNPTTNKIYQAVGYHPVCDFLDYRFVNAPT